MHSSTLIGAVLAALPFIVAQSGSGSFTTGSLGNATVVEDNPPGLFYTATLPMKSFFNPEDPHGNIKGSISATANPDGIGVLFQVNFSNLPKTGGPFLYHLHVDPVPSDGNCTKTLGHVDPFIRGETPGCNSALPQTCQVGDLAGKHGAITSDPFSAQYLDEFASTKDGLGSYFGNRSMVVHFANVTRITCASFVQTGGKSSTNSSNPNGTATGTGGPAMQTINGASGSHAPMAFIVGLMGLATILFI